MEKVKRLRVDKLLVYLAYFSSRERAQRAILAGEVLVDERITDKPGTLIRSDAAIRVICLEPEGSLVALIKPQFELKAAQVGKAGIVRNEIFRLNAVEKIRRFATQQLIQKWIGVINSSIAGAKGNKEFLACLR